MCVLDDRACRGLVQLGRPPGQCALGASGCEATLRVRQRRRPLPLAISRANPWRRQHARYIAACLAYGDGSRGTGELSSINSAGLRVASEFSSLSNSGDARSGSRRALSMPSCMPSIGAGRRQPKS